MLFLDDHPGVREGIADLLKNKNPRFVFFMASTAQEASSLLERHAEISLAIVDLNLDGKSGLEAVPLLRAIKENIPVLVYTMYADRFHLRNALSANIQGYVSKDAPIEELYGAIMQILNGGSFFNNAATKMLSALMGGKDMPIFDSDARTVQIFANYKALSKTEQKIFALLALKKEVAEIAQTIGKKEKTVLNLRTLIYQKMEIRDRLALIEAAQILGIIE